MSVNQRILDWLANADCDRETIIALVCEWANCREADIDPAGGVWICDPQRGHWLDDDDKERLLEWASTR